MERTSRHQHGPAPAPDPAAHAPDAGADLDAGVDLTAEDVLWGDALAAELVADLRLVEAAAQQARWRTGYLPVAS